MLNLFELKATDGSARAGELHALHGVVPTPAFMPVAATILLGNNFHPYLRPGITTIGKLGGLHAFMGWDGPLLTDSGTDQELRLEEEGLVISSLWRAIL